MSDHADDATSQPDWDHPETLTDEERAFIEVMRERFRSQPLHALLGLDLPQERDGKLVVEMPVRNEAFGTTGNLHGGALATLIDVASASAAARSSSFVPGENTLVTADLHVRYLGRPKTDTVRAEAEVVHAGRTLVVVECEVLDGEDRIIAKGDFSGMVVSLRKPLLPDAQPDPNSPEL
ncbi:hypothetical protein B7486_56025 [cyanobacterium TDX16]|nr:hypothetical protein B7486_56025 [cyanobacterium TDX16]